MELGSWHMGISWMSPEAEWPGRKTGLLRPQILTCMYKTTPNVYMLITALNIDLGLYKTSRMSGF